MIYTRNDARYTTKAHKYIPVEGTVTMTFADYERIVSREGTMDKWVAEDYIRQRGKARKRRLAKWQDMHD